MICENILNEIFIFHIRDFFENEDISQYIVDKYSGKCIKRVGVIDKIKEIDIEPPQISAVGFLIKCKIKLKVECVMPKLNENFDARAKKKYNDFTLFHPIAGRNSENIKIVIPGTSEIEEGEVCNIKLLHFKFSNGNYNCIGGFVNASHSQNICMIKLEEE